MNKPKIIAVVGPTAVGKSDLAVKLALDSGGEIVSADSRQVYRGLDVGTGKITEEEMRGVPHHLLDVRDPQEQYTVAEYKRDAEKIIKGILKCERLPIIEGGTGFYIQAVVDGITPPEVPPNKELRRELGQLSKKELVEHLKGLDLERAKDIDTHNPRRLIRAIEIARALGKVPPVKKNPKYTVLQIGLRLPKEKMRKRIDERLTERFEEGMLEEAERLHERGLSFKRMEELGLEYRYMARHLRGKISKEEMIERLQHKIWQYAKRQSGWFGQDKRIRWFSPDEYKEIKQEVDSFLP